MRFGVHRGGWVAQVAQVAQAAHLAAAPGWMRLGLLLIWGVALFGLCWWLLLQGLYQQLAAQAPTQALEQQRMVEGRAALQRAQAQQALVQTQKDQLAVLEATLPSGLNGPSGWATVHEAGRQHGLRMEHFKPGPVGTEKPYPEQRASVRLAGDFDAFLAFQQTMESSSPFAIESFLLVARTHPQGTAAGAGPGLGFEATLLSLHRPPAATPVVLPAGTADTANLASGSLSAKRVADETPSRAAMTDSLASRLSSMAFSPGSASDPFSSERLSPLPVPGVPAAERDVPAKVLESVPLSSMRMVGSVRTEAQAAALVVVAGALHAVRVGDKLGNARGQVSEVRLDGLTVLEPAGFDQAKARSMTLPLAKD